MRREIGKMKNIVFDIDLLRKESGRNDCYKKKSEKKV